MKLLGFESNGTDPDVWMRLATLKDCIKIYDHVLLYVDNCLVVSENVESILNNEIGRYVHSSCTPLVRLVYTLVDSMRLRLTQE